MKISLRLFRCALGFSALALTGALAQSPAAFSVHVVGIFDYPGATQTQPQKINGRGDAVGIFIESSGASRASVKFRNGNFSPPIVDPNDAGNLTQPRGIDSSRLVCGGYLDYARAFEGCFLSNNAFTNYAPEPTLTVVLGVNDAGDFCGSEIPSGTGIQSGFVNIGGVLTDLVVTDTTATLAHSLNATNQSCGYYIDAAGVTHGFWRDSDGTIHALIDPVGSTGTILFGSNDTNLVVGRYSDAAGATHGILFRPPDQFVLFDFPGVTFTSESTNGARSLVVLSIPLPVSLTEFLPAWCAVARV